jgi:hypothetical protein
MKKQLFAVLGLGLLLSCVSASAQTVNMKVNVPFNFIVSGATLPSGEYTIQGLGIAGNAISIRSEDKTAKSLVLASRCESRKTPEQSKLVFHKYGDRYFLAQIWMAGNDAGHELPLSRREREVARDYTLQEVVLVASLR